MFELKPISTEAIPAALEKANRYRLLNEPGAAESIYLDILAVDADNQDAIKNLVLAMSDRFGKDYAISDTNINEYNICQTHEGTVVAATNDGGSVNCLDQQQPEVISLAKAFCPIL